MVRTIEASIFVTASCILTLFNCINRSLPVAKPRSNMILLLNAGTLEAGKSDSAHKLSVKMLTGNRCVKLSLDLMLPWWIGMISWTSTGTGTSKI